MLGSLTVYAEDYKYIPPEAPENWREMSYKDRQFYIYDLVGDDKKSAFNNDVYTPILLSLVNSRIRKLPDDVVLNSPNVVDNIDFLTMLQANINSHPNEFWQTWATLQYYTIFYDYDYLYQVCEGKKPAVSDFYETFPVYNPDYTPPETLKTREEILSVLAPAEPEPDPATVSDPDSVSDTDILLEPMSEDNPIPVISIVVAGTLVGLGVFAFFLKGS